MEPEGNHDAFTNSYEFKHNLPKQRQPEIEESKGNQVLTKPLDLEIRSEIEQRASVKTRY